MAAVTADNWLVLPRVGEPPLGAVERPVQEMAAAQRLTEGAGFPVRRPFPGPGLSLRAVDPFLLLDQMGPVAYGPQEAKGAPWHPHRGFETVTYLMDGVMRHQDTNGGGGLIQDGGTQWMTAGSGILHDEMPTEELVKSGGYFHGIQLWVNLPKRLKWTPPRYQDIRGDRLTLLSSHDGSALIRVIAGSLGGHEGPGSTWTPIVLAHASVAAGARLHVPWNPAFGAMAYALLGHGTAGHEAAPLPEGQLAVFGPGDALTVTAGPRQTEASANFEVLLLGGAPIWEPIAHWGPFVMNTREEIVQAFDDFHAGRMGIIPATTLEPSSPRPHGLSGGGR